MKTERIVVTLVLDVEREAFEMSVGGNDLSYVEGIAHVAAKAFKLAGVEKADAFVAIGVDASILSNKPRDSRSVKRRVDDALSGHASYTEKALAERKADDAKWTKLRVE